MYATEVGDVRAADIPYHCKTGTELLTLVSDKYQWKMRNETVSDLRFTEKGTNHKLYSTFRRVERGVFELNNEGVALSTPTGFPKVAIGKHLAMAMGWIRMGKLQNAPSHGFDSSPEQRGRNLLQDRRRCLVSELFLQLAFHQRGRGLCQSVWHDARHPLRVFESQAESSDGASRHGFVAGSALPAQRRARLLRGADDSISTREERRDRHCGSASGRERWHLGSVRAGRSDATHLASEI